MSVHLHLFIQCDPDIRDPNIRDIFSSTIVEPVLPKQNRPNPLISELHCMIIIFSM